MGRAKDDGIIWLVLGMLSGAILLMFLLWEHRALATPRHREAAERSAKRFFPWLGSKRRTPGPSGPEYARALHELTQPLSAHVFRGGIYKVQGKGANIFGAELKRSRGGAEARKTPFTGKQDAHALEYGTSLHLIAGDIRDRLLQFRGSFTGQWGFFEAQVTRGAYAASHEALMLTSHPWDGEHFGVGDFEFRGRIDEPLVIPEGARVSRAAWITAARQSPGFGVHRSHPLISALAELDESSPLDLGVPMLDGIISVILRGESYPAVGDFVR